MAKTVSPRGPIPLALYDPPAGDWWSETQWNVFMSLIEAVVLPIVSESDITDKRKQKKISQAEFNQALGYAQSSMAKAPTPEVFAAYLSERALDNPDFVRTVRRVLGDTPPSLRNSLGSVLSLLSYGPCIRPLQPPNSQNP